MPSWSSGWSTVQAMGGQAGVRMACLPIPGDRTPPRRWCAFFSSTDRASVAWMKRSGIRDNTVHAILPACPHSRRNLFLHHHTLRSAVDPTDGARPYPAGSILVKFTRKDRYFLPKDRRLNIATMGGIALSY